MAEDLQRTPAAARDRSRSPVRSPTDDVTSKKEEDGPKRFICFSYRDRGSCRYGDECSFSHEVERERKDVCRDFTYKGVCSYGTRCRFSHGDVKTSATADPPKIPAGSEADLDQREPCRDFQNKGRCGYGERCKFKHVGEHGHIVPPSSVPQVPGPQGELCRDFQNMGRCKYGAACKYLHSAHQAPPPAIAASWPPQTQSYYNPMQVTRDSSHVCAEFTAYGICRTGDGCPLVHLASCARPPGSVITTSVAPAYPMVHHMPGLAPAYPGYPPARY